MTLVFLSILILISSIVQTIFGVGILLLGTPILLFFGFEYYSILATLLPISLTISCMQLIKLRKNLEKAFVLKILCLSVPVIPIGIIFAGQANNKIGLFIGLALLLIAIKWRKEKPIVPHRSWIRSLEFILVGFVHGLTNLGGALLPALALQEKKLTYMANIAFSYAIFASTQLLSLYFVSPKSLNDESSFVIFLIFLSIFGNLIGRRVASRIKENKYSHFLRLFLAGMGLLLVFRNI